MADVVDLKGTRRRQRLFGKNPDADVAWALRHLEEDADMCSMVNGSADESTKEARRLETIFKRLAREAGYDTV
jgi:hypothetical protein